MKVGLAHVHVHVHVKAYMHNACKYRSIYILLQECGPSKLVL